MVCNNLTTVDKDRRSYMTAFAFALAAATLVRLAGAQDCVVLQDMQQISDELNTKCCSAADASGGHRRALQASCHLGRCTVECAEAFVPRECQRRRRWRARQGAREGLRCTVTACTARR